ncbi:MAG TPA: hypothetical protein VF163_13770 [Micromonosporaceae bacterium]
MRRLLVGLSALALTAVVAGCGHDTSTGEPAGPTATPTVDRKAALAALVTAAAIKPAELKVKRATSDEAAISLTLPCQADPAALPATGHTWSYSQSKPAVVAHSVFAYEGVSGQDVVRAISTAVGACTSWTWGGVWTMKVLGGFPVASPAGVDGVIAYCHLGTLRSGSNKGDRFYLCDGVVSRGALIAKVDTLALTQAQAQANLKAALPLAAAALVRAVPGAAGSPTPSAS